MFKLLVENINNVNEESILVGNPLYQFEYTQEIFLYCVWPRKIVETIQRFLKIRDFYLFRLWTGWINTALRFILQYFMFIRKNEAMKKHTIKRNYNRYLAFMHFSITTLNSATSFTIVCIFRLNRSDFYEKITKID